MKKASALTPKDLTKIVKERYESKKSNKTKVNRSSTKKKKKFEKAPDIFSFEQLSDKELERVYDKVGIESELGLRSFKDFCEITWERIEPGQPFVKNAWHNEAISDHLEALHRGDIRKLLIAVPPGVGKPVEVHTPVLMEDGSELELGQITIGDKVITHKGLPAEILDVYDQGELDCLEITTHSGRKVVAALDHPFLTPEGWVEVKNLVVGQCLGTPTKIVTEPYYKRSNEEMRLLGYMLGDGSARSSVSIVGNDVTELEDVKLCAETLKFKPHILNRKGKNGNIWTVQLAYGGIDWAKTLGIYGKLSKDKRVPLWAFATTDENIANLIGAYFACDGSINKKGSNRNTPYLEMYSISKGLLEDIQKLLLRLSIYSLIRYKPVKYKGELKDSWRLAVSTISNIAKFKTKIPICHSKGTKLTKWEPIATTFDSDFISDPITEIKEVGKRHCKCLRVYRDSSFLANNFATHNSTWACIFFPAWIWTQTPHWKMAFGSYGYQLSGRDAEKTLKLLTSKWFKDRWGHRFKVTKKVVSQITNDHGGIRAVASVGGQTLGIRADLVVGDDPLNIQQANSEVGRAKVHRWWLGMTTRGDINQREVVIQQRLHDDDLIGHLRNNIGGYQYLCLPAEYEKARCCVTMDISGNEFFKDPRKVEGEALFPAKFPNEYYRIREKDPETAGLADAMFRQDPVPEGGNIIKKKWFRFYQGEPKEIYDKCSMVILSADTAIKEKSTSSFTVIQIWGKDGPNIYLIDQLRARLGFTGILEALKAMIEKWPRAGAKLIEDKASGPDIIDTLSSKIPGLIPSEGNDDKEDRMHAITWMWQAGNVYVPGKPPKTTVDDIKKDSKPDFTMYPWMNEWYDEIVRYPMAVWTDQAMAMSQALMYLATKMVNPKALPVGVGTGGNISELRRMSQRAFSIR